MSRPVFFSPILRFPEDSIFHNTNFLRLWLAQILSQVAINLFYFILAVSIYNDTRSNQAVSILVITFGAAAFLFSMFAGVFVDHTDKRKVMLLSNFSRFFLMLFFLFFTQNYVITLMFVFVDSAITQFFMPAEAATIPLIVHDKNLVTANSLFTISMYTGQVIAYLLGGYILSKIGLGASLFLLSVMFFAAGASILFTSIPHVHSTYSSFRSLLAQMKFEFFKGFQYIRDTRSIQRPLMYLATSQIIVAMFFALIPGYAVEVLGVPAEDASVFMAGPVVIGMIVGSLAITRISKKISQEKIIQVSVGGAIAGILLLAYNQRIPFQSIQKATGRLREFQHFLPPEVNKFLGVDVLLFAVVFLFVIGACNAIIVILHNTKLQQACDVRMRGRVFGVLQTLVTAIALLPILFAGYIADHIGVNWAFGIMGLVILLLHAVIQMVYRDTK